jgi:hypothetical protein
MDDYWVAFIAVSLGILCGIIAIIAAAINENKKIGASKSIRQSIIENHTDAETARELLKQDAPKQKNKYLSLQWGCALLGLAVGFVFVEISHLGQHGDSYLLLLAGFLGVGLLVSFFIKRHLEQKEAERKRQEEQLPQTQNHQPLSL